MGTDPFLWIEWIKVWWIQLSNINWILVNWYMCLSWKLKHPLVLPKFHLEFHHKWMLVVCVLRWWKFHLEFIYGQIYAFIVIRAILYGIYSYSQLYHNQTWLSEVIEWLVHNYMLRFFILDLAYKIL